LLYFFSPWLRSFDPLHERQGLLDIIVAYVGLWVLRKECRDEAGLPL
jgi:hypothetical protein